MLCPDSIALKKTYFIKQNRILFWWNVRVSYSKSTEPTATEMVTFHELLNQWNSMFFLKPLWTMGSGPKSLHWNHYLDELPLDHGVSFGFYASNHKSSSEY